MIFKNMIVYRTFPGWIPNFELMGKDFKFVPLEGTNLVSSGWEDVRGGEIFIKNGDAYFFSMKTQTRLLPSSVVNEASRMRAEEIEQRDGYKPGRKQMKEIKEQVTTELISRAFCVSSSVQAWIDVKNGFLAINTSSRSKADDFIGLLFKGNDSMRMRLLKTKMAPTVAMQNWIVTCEAPAGFTVDKDLEIKSRGADTASVRFTNETLDKEAVLTFLKEGKDPVKLAMTWSDKVSFVLNADCSVLSKLKILAIDEEIELQKADADSREQLENIEMTLMVGMFSNLILAIGDCLEGIENLPANPEDGSSFSISTGVVEEDALECLPESM